MGRHPAQRYVPVDRVTAWHQAETATLGTLAMTLAVMAIAAVRITPTAATSTALVTALVVAAGLCGATLLTIAITARHVPRSVHYVTVALCALSTHVAAHGLPGSIGVGHVVAGTALLLTWVTAFLPKRSAALLSGLLLAVAMGSTVVNSTAPPNVTILLGIGPLAAAAVVLSVAARVARDLVGSTQESERTRAALARHVAGALHEPLSQIRTRADELTASALGPTERRIRRAQLELHLAHVDRILGDLDELATVDEVTGHTLEREDIALTRILADATSHFAPDLRVRVRTVAEPVTVHVDATLADRAVAAILRDLLDVGSAVVHVTATPTPTGGLRAEFATPAAPDAYLAAAGTDRRYTTVADAVRTVTINLAIAERVAQAHGGRCRYGTRRPVGRR